MPARDTRLPHPALLLLGVALLAGPAGANEAARLEPLWVEADRPGTAQGWALLNLPMSWQSGDAAVVLVSDPRMDATLRDRLIGSLLDAGAAVLEIDVRPPRRAASTAEVVAAGAALRGQGGAGLVAAVGLGLGGAPGALLASVQPGFVAHLGIAGRDMAFVPGAGPVAPHERWPDRAGPFCAAIAWAIKPSPVPADAEEARGAEAWQACAAALVPQPAPAHPARR
jgi:hypothetical protein